MALLIHWNCHSVLLLLLVSNCISVFACEISCSSSSILVHKGEEIGSIECLDDYSIHLPLFAQNLPYGLTFDGKTLSGKIIDSFADYFIFVYNNCTSFKITANVIDNPLFLDYGVSTQRIYSGVDMIPLYPKSNTYLDSYSIQASSFDGLQFDNKTGAISGIPVTSQSHKSILLKVTGSNAFGSVSTQLSLYVMGIPESFSEGVEVCIVPVAEPIPDLYPEFFDTSNSTCFKQSSFSWADHYEKSTMNHSHDKLGFLTSHGAVRVNSYFFTPYSTPTSFTLSSTSPVLLYLDHYHSPLLSSSSSSSPTERTVTIKLERGFHHLVAYTTTFSIIHAYSYFSLFFSYHCYESESTLLSTNSLLFPGSSPRHAYFPYTVGFEGIPLKINAVSPFPLSQLDAINTPESLQFTSSSQLLDPNPSIGEYDYSIRVKNEFGERYAHSSYRIEENREGVLVTVSEVVENDPDVLMSSHCIWSLKQDIVYQREVKSFEDFNITVLPSSVVHPLVEYNTTLMIGDINQYKFIYDEECDVYLNEDKLKKDQIYETFVENEFVNVYMRCEGLKSHHSLYLQALLNSTDNYSFLASRSSFSFEIPVMQCVMNEPCDSNSIFSLPANCSLMIRDDLPSGFTLLSNGTLIAVPSAPLEKQSFHVFCEDSHYETTLTILVSDGVFPPSSILLTVDGSEIGKELVVSMGVDFFIGVNVDYSIGTTVTVQPALPSSVLVTPTFITGNITQLLNQSFTITARNQKGEYSRELHIRTEGDSMTQYFIHILTGKGTVRATLPDSTLIDVRAIGGLIIPFTTVNGSLNMQFVCRDAEGCWFTIETSTTRLPSMFVHYGESYKHLFTFPLPSLTVLPLITDVMGAVHQPAPTILWEQTGFYSDVVLVDLPSWLQYNPLENRIEGIAEEEGLFSGHVLVVGSEETYDIPVNITIIDTVDLFRNETVISLIYHNENHSSLLTYYSFYHEYAIEEIDLESPSVITFLSYLIVPNGLHNLTFTSSDYHWVDIKQSDVLLTTREPSEEIVFFFVETLVHLDDDWLLYDLFDPLESSWNTLYYEDCAWNVSPAGWMTVEEQDSFYLRKHFTTVSAQWTGVGMKMEVNAGVEVYVDGRLIYRSGLTDGCKQKKCVVVNSDHLIQPKELAFAISQLLGEESEGILAVHIIPFTPRTPIFFRATLFPICSRTQLSNSHTSVTRSAAIVPNESDPKVLVSPFTSYVFGNSLLPSSVTLSLAYPASLSHFHLFSSSSSLRQNPSYVMITGTTISGNQVVLGGKHHPQLWSHLREELIIPIDSSYLLRDITLTVYGSDYIGNTAHYYGAIKLFSYYQTYCEKDGSFKQTAVNDYALVSINDENEKGFGIRVCQKVVNETNPLVVTGEWDPANYFVVKKVPHRGYSFIEFVMIMSNVNKEVSYLFTPFDLEEVYIWIFSEEKVDVFGIRVYRISDGSSNYKSTFTFFVQVITKSKQSQKAKMAISNSPLVVASQLAKLHPEHYSTSLDIVLNGDPVIIDRPKDTWVIVLQICSISIIVLIIIVLLWIYRKPLWNGYKRIANEYRMRRRKVVFDEYDLPYNMSYDPKEITSESTLLSFETPYGDIHLVQPLIHSVEKKYNGFIVAEEL